MFNHLAGNNDVECFIERDLLEFLQIRAKKIFAAFFLQNIESFLVKIESVKLARRFFEFKMQQHFAFDGLLRVWIIRTSEMQYFFAFARFFYKIDALNQFKIFTHSKINDW